MCQERAGGAKRGANRVSRVGNRYLCCMAGCMPWWAVMSMFAMVNKQSAFPCGAHLLLPRAHVNCTLGFRPICLQQWPGMDDDLDAGALVFLHGVLITVV